MANNNIEKKLNNTVIKALKSAESYLDDVISDTNSVAVRKNAWERVKLEISIAQKYMSFLDSAQTEE